MDDTIVAISTALGVGAISIVRVTGIDAISIVNQVFKGKDLTKQKTHTIHYGYIYDEDEKIDEVLVMLMCGPKTYTTFDTVEINCHGGIHTTKKVLEVLLKSGCRMAMPGEFTKMAFLNGRISLIEAEAVNDLIVAKTDAARTLALNNMSGLLKNKVQDLREKLAQILANIEVNIDYPEYQDEVLVTHDLLENFLQDVEVELKRLVDETKCGKIINEGIKVAIVGRPNVGKSSILNCFLEEDKAIVTDIAGTTRDIVEGTVSLNGVLLNFIDTAGIRQTSDIVEKMGVKKSREVALAADLVLFVVNYNEAITEEDRQLLKELKSQEVIVFVNKNDLECKIDKKELAFYETVYGNTKSDYGLNALKEEILKRFSLDKIVVKDMTYLTNSRQVDLVEKAYRLFANAFDSFKDRIPIDMIEIDLKEAWEILGELIGESYKEELVDYIFSHFCLGK